MGELTRRRNLTCSEAYEAYKSNKNVQRLDGE